MSTSRNPTAKPSSRIRRKVRGGIIRRPTPLGRSRGSTLHWLRLPLMRAHLIYLALATCYIGVTHHAALGPILLIAGIGFVGELAPSSWRRFYLAEGLLLCGGILSFLWMWELDHAELVDGALQLGPEQLEAFQGWIRMIFVAWLLIPSRPGYLRWFAGLAGVELALRSTSAPVQLWPISVLVPAAVVALAWDAHLRVASMRPEDVQVGQTKRARMLSWNGILIAIACVIGMAVGGAVVMNHSPRQAGDFSLPRPDVGPYSFGGINQHMHLGDRNFQDKNPAVAARLTAEDPFAADTYYLRALTLPYLDLESQPGHVSWSAAHEARRQMPPRPSLHQAHPQRLATLYRRADRQDVVLLPDGANHIGLEDMISDIDGNLYRPGLGELNTRYDVDLGAGVYPVRAWNRDRSRYLAVPGSLATRIRRHLPVLQLWRELQPADAASGISAFLRQRCSYSLEDLPEAGPQAGGSILSFMFSEDPAERRGHCQFFATAAVILMRSAGHPARCVVGYASNEVEGNEITFRGLNAHAWAEFQVEGAGGLYWQRFDPTPGNHLDIRAPDRGDVPEEEDPFGDDVADPNEHEDSSGSLLRRYGFWAAALVLLTTAGALVWWLNRRESTSPRERELARQTQTLIALAMELGLPVDRHSSLTTLASGIESKTGCDLQPHLRAHLAARFAAGPVPSPWPVAEIRSAAQRRAEEQHTTPAS